MVITTLSNQISSQVIHGNDVARTYITYTFCMPSKDLGEYHKAKS